MKILDWTAGIVFSLALIVILLITSVEAVLYWTPGYFQHEYEKYNVTWAVDMEMEDLLYVTESMMDYLRGDREELQVTTTVGGQERSFFNEREIAHMADVKNLFSGGIILRRGAAAAALSSILLLFFRKKLKLLPRAVIFSTSIFIGLIVLLAAAVSTDFTRYFTIFHEIFFTNDLWLLNPRTDLLINIVPESFFIDTALRIAVLFGVSMASVLGVSGVALRKTFNSH